MEDVEMKDAEDEEEVANELAEEEEGMPHL